MEAKTRKEIRKIKEGYGKKGKKQVKVIYPCA
jgi:hypothetical protein